MGILTALLGDVTFTMNLYNAEQFVKPDASLLCLELPGLGLNFVFGDCHRASCLGD